MANRIYSMIFAQLAVTTKRNVPLAGLAIIFLNTAVLANPIVDGNRIEWPDDGWYQVQRTSDYSTVCEGGIQCEVSPGSYNVINHSTGMRWDDVVVSGTTAPVSPVDSGGYDWLRVTGNTISWTDPGWYQIQSAIDYSTVCEGGSSCEVPAGTYIAVNHSTGQRWEMVNVTGGSSPSETTPESPAHTPGEITVEGNLIRWPDDGWYQIQSQSTFDTLCEGGSECLVADGDYFVINHTLGQRSTVSVGSAETAQPSLAEASILIKDALGILNGRGIQEPLRLQSDYEPRSGLVATSNSASRVTGGYEVLNNFSCNNGGRAHRVEKLLGQYTLLTWTYDNCVTNEETLNGSVTSDLAAWYRFTFDNFSVIQEGSYSLTAHGHYSPDVMGGGGTHDNFSFTYSGASDNLLVTRLSNSTIPRGFFYGGRVDTLPSFTMQRDHSPTGGAPESPIVALQWDVRNDLVLTSGYPDRERIPTGGSMTLTSSAGHIIDLNPNTGDMDTVLIRARANESDSGVEHSVRLADQSFRSEFLYFPSTISSDGPFWTDWLNRLRLNSIAEGLAEYETLAGFSHEQVPCRNPINAQARVVGTSQILNIGDSLPSLVTRMDTGGLICRSDFTGCDVDYEVRFMCPGVESLSIADPLY